MAKIKVKLIGSGEPGDPYRVNLPTYTMVGKPDYTNRTCEVEIPDDEIDRNKTRPDKQKIRQKYRNQPNWDRADLISDV